MTRSSSVCSRHCVSNASLLERGQPCPQGSLEISSEIDVKSSSGQGCQRSTFLLLPWPQKDRLPVRAFDFDAVGLDGRIVLKRVVDDAPIEGVQWFEFDHIAPTPDF